jgi:inner membrane protein
LNIITHLLLGWAVAEQTTLEHRDRSILAWASVAPDLDGVGVIVDAANRALGRPESFLYFRWHHELLHGLPGALAITAVCTLAARSRFRVAILSFALVHLHLLCDFVGSRGPTPADIWPIHYLAPFSSTPTFAWTDQWALNGWQNILLTLLLVGYVFVRANTQGRSPVSLFNRRAHLAFVRTVRHRWATMRGAA